MSYGLAKRGPQIASLEPTICEVTNHSFECSSSPLASETFGICNSESGSFGTR